MKTKLAETYRITKMGYKRTTEEDGRRVIIIILISFFYLLIFFSFNKMEFLQVPALQGKCQFCVTYADVYAIIYQVYFREQDLDTPQDVCIDIKCVYSTKITL